MQEQAAQDLHAVEILESRSDAVVALVREWRYIYVDGAAAVYLSDRASRVLLLILGDDLGKTMSHYLTRRIEQTANIELRRRTQIGHMYGDKSLAKVELNCDLTGQADNVDCAAVFVSIGSAPHTEWLPAGSKSMAMDS